MPDSGFIEADGGRLYHEVEGDGHPLLLLHGGLGDMRMWDAQVAAFAGRYSVIRYDLRGYGRTETEDVAFSNRADAAAVLAHLDAGSAHVVGQSRGAVIALDLAIERPELVDGLVLIAGGASGHEPELAPGVEGPPWEEMERLWEQQEWAALADLETRIWVDGWGQPEGRVDPSLRQRVRGDILATYRAQKVEGRPQPLDPPAAGRLQEVKAPTLVIVGTADEPGAVESARFVASGINGARLEVFDGVAHMVHMEQPDRLNRLVLDFLAEVDGARRP